jgi:hypothetical protein
MANNLFEEVLLLNGDKYAILTFSGFRHHVIDQVNDDLIDLFIFPTQM